MEHLLILLFTWFSITLIFSITKKETLKQASIRFLITFLFNALFLTLVYLYDASILFPNR